MMFKFSGLGPAEDGDGIHQLFVYLIGTTDVRNTILQEIEQGRQLQELL